MVKFSIVIPTRNSSKTIKNCLSSVLNQSFTNFEILLMDGLSIDNTLDIVKEYQDSRVKIFSEKDLGVYDAMNKGIDFSSGEWLYFLGSDDLLENEHVLERVLEYTLLNYKIIYGNVLIMDDTLWANKNDVYDGYFNLSKLLSKNICHQAMFYHKSIFNNVRYNIKYTICADWDLTLRCFSKYSFLYINLIVAKFDGGGVSSYIMDLVFPKEKWRNIVDYYGFRVLNKEFRKYHQDIYNQIKFNYKYLGVKIFYFLYQIYERIKRNGEEK